MRLGLVSGNVNLGALPMRLVRRSVVIAVVAAALTAAFSLTMPNQYVVQSGLLLQPPPLISKPPVRGASNEPKSPAEDISFMMVKPLTVKDYSALLMSDEIVATLRDMMQQLLEQRGHPEKKLLLEDVRSKMRVGTPILAQTGYGVEYQLIINLNFEGEIPEVAAEIANAWADLGIKMSEEVNTKGKEGLVEFFEGRVQSVSQDLNKTEKDIESLESEWDVENTEARLKEMNTALTKYELQLIDLETKIANTQASLAQVQADIANEPEKKTLRKAPPDEAYWLLEAGKQTPDSSKVMVTEEMNEIFLKLREEQTILTEKLAGLTKEKEALGQKVSELRTQISGLQTKQADFKRRQRVLLRDAGTYQQQYVRIADNREAARMAEAQSTPALKLAYKAVPPERKVGPKRSLMVIVAALIGACIAPAHFAAARSLRALSKPTNPNGDA